MSRKTFTVTAERGRGPWWVTECAEAGCVSQVRRLDQVADDIREAIAYQTGLSADEFDIEVVPALPDAYRQAADEADRLRADKPARRVVKTSRWLLLRNRENVPDEQVVRLEELLAANKALLTVYLLKEDLKGLWRYRREAWAWKAWKSWKRRALRSGLEPLRVFVRRLEPYLSGILAHCRWPLGTNLVEGINNKIKVIKRVAYGYRDDAYFFLKIRAAFPGLG